jgi:hypothetical protein
MDNQIQSFEHACRVLGINPSLPKVDMLPEEDGISLVAYYKLTKICEAANFIENGNKPWKPNKKDLYEDKNFVWYLIPRDEFISGIELLQHNWHDVTSTVTSATYRLCFKNRLLALTMANRFKDLFRDYLMYKD